jgi:hypothetical protein
VYAPRSYLEIGVDRGRSLALSQTRTIAVDPAYQLTWEVNCDVQLVRATSDDFFARQDALAHLPDGLVDLAFIDGIHLFEHALRDFVNVERNSHWASVILVDDVFPRTGGEASRLRGTRKAWTGDVYKVTDLLARCRPDLLVLPLDIEPTGVLLVLGADPDNAVLDERYDELVAEHSHPDPQPVPESVLRRETAFDPTSLSTSLWTELRAARDSGRHRDAGWEAIRRSFMQAARPTEPRSLLPGSVPKPAGRQRGSRPRKSTARTPLVSAIRATGRRASTRLTRPWRRLQSERRHAVLEARRPPGTALASMFFEKHPRFFATSRTGPLRGRLNLRYEAIFAENRDIFAGAKVIDIASHDGRWSLAALETGAAAVVGIEARGDLVDAARDNLAHYGAHAGRYRFVAGDVFDVLSREAESADVVLCLGFLYHTLRYPELMRRIRDLGPRYLVIDTVVLPGRTKPLVQLHTERAERQGNAAGDSLMHGDKTLVGWPSVRGLEFLVETYGFEVERYSDWASLLRDNPEIDNISDYAEARRVTARCVSVS